jgi:hypothetical protein
MPVERAGGGQYFNRVTSKEEEQSDAVEGWLSVVESYAGPALRRLVETQAAPDKADRFTIAFYVALLGARTPHALQGAQAMSSMFLDLHWGVWSHDSEWFAKLCRDAGVGESAEQIEELRQRMKAPGSVSYADPRSEAFRTAISTAGHVAGLGMAMHWTLRLSETPLVVGDHPVTHYHRERPRFPWTEPTWVSTPTSVTTVPLTTHVALELTPGPRKFDVAELDRDEAALLNLRSYGWASRFVFGESQEALDELRHAAEQDPSAVPRASRLHQVVLAPDAGFRLHEEDEHPADWPSRVWVPNQRGEMELCRYRVVSGDNPEEMRAAAEWAARAVKRVAQRQQDEEGDSAKAA